MPFQVLVVSLFVAISLLLGNVVDIDPDSKHVFLEDGAILDYDSLIVAAGSQTSFFGHNDWEQWLPA